MVIALIVLGPQRLPDAARQVGKVMGDLRRFSSGFQNEMKTAFTDADDPTRISARRNVLAKEAPVVADDEPHHDPVVEQVDDLVDEQDDDEQQHAEAESDVSEAVAAVSNHPVATPKKAPPARAKTTSTTATKATAAKKAAAAKKTSPAKKVAATKKASPDPPVESVNVTADAVPEAPPPRSAS